MPSKKKPNLFIIGAPKCGTTAMSRYLASHPDVFFSNPNELHFFYRGGGNYWKTGKIKTIEDYLSIFEGSETYSVVAEGTPSYLRSQAAIKRIIEFNPDAQFIVMVRNPADMFVSLFWQTKLSRQGDKARSPEEAWEKNDKYKWICSVGHQLEKLYMLVPREQVLVIFFDDLATDTWGAYRKALDFLGLKPDQKILKPHKERKKKPSRFLKILNQNVAKFKEKTGLRFSTGIIKLLNKAEKPFRKNRYAPLHPRVRKEIVNYFKEDIRKLERLENRDLSHWLHV